MAYEEMLFHRYSQMLLSIYHWEQLVLFRSEEGKKRLESLERAFEEANKISMLDLNGLKNKL